MSEWVRVCSAAEAPAEGSAVETEAAGIAVCLARHRGVLHALDNWCPHRRGPLGQGWLEDGKVVCPWHSWTFDLVSGAAEFPEGEQVAVFPVQVQGDDVLVDISSAPASATVTQS